MAGHTNCMVAVWRCGHHSGTIRASRWDKSGTPFLDRDLRGPFAAGTVNVGRFWGSSDVEDDVSMQKHILILLCLLTTSTVYASVGILAHLL